MVLPGVCTNRDDNPAGWWGRIAAVFVVSVVLGLVTALGSNPASAASNGAVAWGGNSSGQLGDGTGGKEGIDVPVPVAVDSVAGVTQLSGGSGSMALLNNGTVMAWGNNDDGELGIGNWTGPELACEGEESEPEKGCSLQPIEVPGVSEVTAVSAGEHYDMALRKNGSVLAWGENLYGQLSDEYLYGPENCNGQPCETHPHNVQGLHEEAVAVAAGNASSFALMKGGYIEAWGGILGGSLA